MARESQHTFVGVPISGESGTMQNPDDGSEVPVFGLRFKDGPDEYLVLLSEEQKDNIVAFWAGVEVKPKVEVARVMPILPT
jgi:hypothetical protein